MVQRLVTVLATVVLMVSGHLVAQEAETPAVAAVEKVRTDLKADVRQLLESDKTVDQAWGAYYAGKYGFTELTPLVWPLVDPENENFRDPYERCIRSALIDLGATADAEKFELLLEKNWSVCALNAAIHGESAEQLVTLMKRFSYASMQIATCNKLLDMKHAGLAKELLSRINVTMDINIWDEPGHGRGRGMAISRGCGVIAISKGYPPIVDYSLVHRHPREGDVLLAPGKTNIYLRRREEADRSMGIGSVSSNVDIVQYRLTSLYQLSGQYIHSHNTTLRSKHSLNTTWTTADALETTVANRVEYLRKEWRELKASLVKDKLLAEEDSAALSLDISLTITDCREEKKGPALPTAKDLEEKVLGKRR